MKAALAVIAVLAGCYHPSFDDCAVSCAQSGKCPSGFECVLGMCRSMTGECGGGSDQMDAPDVSGWQFRKKLIVSDAGANVTDFPVLVRITDRDLMNLAQPDGGDIRFTDSTGQTALPHQTERYANGDLVAWVKVPQLVQGAATDIYMYFGNPAAPDQQTPAAVWDVHYLGVWHMSDGAGTSIADSTSAMRTGTKGAQNTPAAIDAGLIGGAHTFLGAPSDYFTLATDLPLDIDTLTVEAWIRFTGGPNSLTRQFYGVPPSFSKHPYVRYQDPTSGAGSQGRYIVPNMKTSETFTTQPGTVAPASWIHVMVTWTGGVPAVYANGNILPLATVSNVPTSSPQLVSIGGAASGLDANTAGVVDEVRLSNVARDQAYAIASTTQGAEGAMLVRASALEALP